MRHFSGRFLTLCCSWMLVAGLANPSIGDEVPATEVTANQVPAEDTAAEASWKAFLEERRDWWSLKPVTNPAPPKPRADPWAKHPIDAFVAHRLEKAGLNVAAPADPRSLLRRLRLVILGLPPTPNQVREFETESGRDLESAVTEQVDMLLSSPHFGERWARHWMDVVRFTETHGNEHNYEVHHAYRYRNYLIRAFNFDLPYDDFVREHIAGDLLPQPRWNEAENINESVIGTAFYRFGEANHDDCVTLPKIGYDILDNQLDTLTKSFQAFTVACARCHDHKIDPVSMKDYYALLGILKSSRLVAHTLDAPSVNASKIEQLSTLKPQIRAEVAKAWLAQTLELSDYLLAADAKKRELENAEQLAEGLDSNRIDQFLKTLKPREPFKIIVAGVDATEPVALIVFDEARDIRLTSTDNPMALWMKITGEDSASEFKQSWDRVRSDYQRSAQENAKFNTENFQNFADFRGGDLDGWASSGQGLRSPGAVSGDFAVAHEGDRAVDAVFPAGCFSHRISKKLNGVMHSPAVDATHKRISFHVSGDGSSAIRLVSNNCQLNYENYRALVSSSWRWITFEIPDNAKEFRCFAELMTKFNNPKFPDQLGTLGGDKELHRKPWDEMAADPRSFFGITQAVLHDCDEAPRADFQYLQPILGHKELSSLEELAELYESAIRSAIRAWQDERATDVEVRWLHWMVTNNLIAGSMTATDRLAELVQRYRETEASLSRPRVVPGLADFDEGQDQPLLEAGDNTKLSDPVPRRFLEVISSPGASFDKTGSGRRALAEAIASPDNPLTARVMVNRVWHHMFGTGLVASVDDFGHLGELPSHPELLDHLAAWFVENGWSVKQLIRYIARSKTFQQSQVAVSAARAVDPRNRLLHHYPARRMEAESIRDAILATSGQLDLAMFGRSIQPYREKSYARRRLFAGPLDGHRRRSLYTKINLMEGPRFLETFNFPGSKVTQGRRDFTNVPTQALSLLNDSFVIGQAEAWGTRLSEDGSSTLAQRIDRIFEVALARPATESDTQRFEKLADRLVELHQVPAQDILTSAVVWKDIAHVMFNSREFVYIP